MDWFLWLLVGWWTWNALVSIAWIGREREPITPQTAVILVSLSAALITGLLVTR